MKKLILFILLIISTSIGGSEESYKMEITLKLEGITIKQADDLLTQCSKLKPKPVVTYSLKGNRFRR
jgi:hypothetical protein